MAIESDSSSCLPIFPWCLPI